MSDKLKPEWPFPTPGTVCKGSIALGSGCGLCQRCKEEMARLQAGNPKNDKLAQQSKPIKSETEESSNVEPLTSELLSKIILELNQHNASASHTTDRTFIRKLEDILAEFTRNTGSKS